MPAQMNGNEVRRKGFRFWYSPRINGYFVVRTLPPVLVEPAKGKADLVASDHILCWQIHNAVALLCVSGIRIMRGRPAINTPVH